MHSRNFFPALVLVIFLGCWTVQARKVLIYGRGCQWLRELPNGSPVKSWLKFEVTKVHDEPEEGLSRLWGSLRLPSDEMPIPGTNFEKKLLPSLYSQNSQLFDDVSQSFICKTCLNISTQAEQVLSDPNTLKEILDFLNSTICGFILPGLGEQCMDLAMTYVPEVIQQLREFLTPDHLCVDTKLCPSLSVLFLDDDRVCAMCEKFSTEVLGHLSENSTKAEAMAALHYVCSKLGGLSSRCNMLVDAYVLAFFGKVQLLTPQGVCHKMKLCNAVSEERKSYCATCVHAINEMQAQLRNPAIHVEKMIEVLSNECTKMSYSNQCKEIVAQYGSFILASIESHLNAGTVCTKIHACEFVPASTLTTALQDMRSKTQHTSQEMLPVIQLISGLDRLTA